MLKRFFSSYQCVALRKTICGWWCRRILLRSIVWLWWGRKSYGVVVFFRGTISCFLFSYVGWVPLPWFLGFVYGSWFRLSFSFCWGSLSSLSLLIMSHIIVRRLSRLENPAVIWDCSSSIGSNCVWIMVILLDMSLEHIATFFWYHSLPVTLFHLYYIFVCL
jgi:hypothetical protein